MEDLGPPLGRNNLERELDRHPCPLGVDHSPPPECSAGFSDRGLRHSYSAASIPRGDGNTSVAGFDAQKRSHGPFDVPGPRPGRTLNRPADAARLAGLASRISTRTRVPHLAGGRGDRSRSSACTIWDTLASSGLDSTAPDSVDMQRLDWGGDRGADVPDRTVCAVHGTGTGRWVSFFLAMYAIGVAAAGCSGSERSNDVTGVIAHVQSADQMEAAQPFLDSPQQITSYKSIESVAPRSTARWGASRSSSAGRVRAMTAKQ